MTLANNIKPRNLAIIGAAQPGMQATRSARPISGGVPNSFPFPRMSGIPTARA